MPNPQAGNSLNMTTANPSKPHSRFNLNKKFGLTPVFGRNTPFFGLEVVPGDGPIRILPSCETRSYTLKAPVFGDVKKHVAFYQVPLQCILPFNWEKIVVNPSHGSDVQGSSTSTNIVPCLDGVNCVISDFVGRLVTPFLNDFNTIKATDVSTISPKDYIFRILHFVIKWENFLSHGSLLSHFGIHYGDVFTFYHNIPSEENLKYTFDSYCQYLLSCIENLRFRVTDDDGTSSITGAGAFHIRRVLDFMRTHALPAKITYLGSTSISLPSLSNWNVTHVASVDYTEPLNYGRLCAYQIVNAHYYTNDRIDYIYTADLYRQYIGSFINDSYGASTFTYNGISCQYDFLSGFYFSDIIRTFFDTSITESSESYSIVYPIIFAVFGFNNSLRYLDYFTGARPRNLAISGPNTPTNVAVENNSVDVVNITKSIVAQRFLNAVARVPQNIEDYSEKILGRKPSYDWHNPKYLFSYDMNLFTQEVENTGAGQLSDANSVTSVLRGRSGDLEFTVDIDRHSYIIGIESFDVERFYHSTQDRNTMAIDRFDMFVPELQYIGDQELKRSELIAGSVKDMPFGYTLRDMQFKQLFNDCAGGFVENLPGWLFKFNIDDFNYRDANELQIGPEFIRSKPTELDEFYLSLTGLTLASYFHFIEVWSIRVSADRPMIAAPNIL